MMNSILNALPNIFPLDFRQTKPNALSYDIIASLDKVIASPSLKDDGASNLDVLPNLEKVRFSSLLKEASSSIPDGGNEIHHGYDWKDWLPLTTRRAQLYSNWEGHLNRTHQHPLRTGRLQTSTNWQGHHGSEHFGQVYMSPNRE